MLYLHQKIICVLVYIQIAVPGYPEGTAGLDTVKLKKLGQLVDDYVLQKNKAPAVLGADIKIPLEYGRHLNNSEDILALL